MTVQATAQDPDGPCLLWLRVNHKNRSEVKICSTKPSHGFWKMCCDGSFIAGSANSYRRLQAAGSAISPATAALELGFIELSGHGGVPFLFGPARATPVKVQTIPVSDFRRLGLSQKPSKTAPEPTTHTRTHSSDAVHRCEDLGATCNGRDLIFDDQARETGHGSVDFGMQKFSVVVMDPNRPPDESSGFGFRNLIL
ncbi:hypothetical protein RHGRI_020823 [Rhododendron griersonianum]|uniref:Uncharacterized protein n=1 Tax=Rhododendron griersonianum TaxID=479676 RepID=A0AAV6JHT1_9ERIC|nr:hypothetical protein RHGRI_020823 [Rhododendron griersonianum]